MTTSVQLDERVVEAAVGHLEIMGIYLGRRLGLYEAIDAAGSVTPGELAEKAGVSERYAREWLEQQAVGGYLTVEDPAAEPSDRRFRMTDHQRGVLVDPEDPAHVSPLALMTMGIAATIEEVIAAYRDGTGVGYDRFGSEFRNGQGAVNRPAFSRDLIDAWIPAIPEVQSALESGAPVRVLDIGTGQGWAAIAVARAYPAAEVVGIDADEASVADARRHAAERDVEVEFVLGDSATHEYGRVDLALILEVLHDLAHPTATLRSLRASLAPDGVVLVADEQVADVFTAPGDLLDRMMYGWSISTCLPAALTEDGSEGIGTVIRASTIERLARDAGFGSVEVLDVDGGFFRLYALRA